MPVHAEQRGKLCRQGIDQDDLAPGNQPVADENIHRFADLAIEFDHTAGGNLHQFGDGHAFGHRDDDLVDQFAAHRADACTAEDFT